MNYSNEPNKIEDLVLIKNNIDIIKPLSYDESLIYNKKYRCPVRWLEHFSKSFFITNFEFIKKLDEAFRPVFELYIGKRLMWQRISLTLVPYHGDFKMYKITDEYYYLYVLTCNIGDSSTGIVNGNITWYINQPETEIDFYNNVFKHDIIVNWIPEEKYPHHILNWFPAYVEKISKLTFKPKVKFPVYSWLSSMPHEGKFAITLFDIADVEKVFEALETARCKWNTQTDEARATNNPSLEQGYCHTITFDGVEDNIAYWYIDAGSAHEGIHEYLLRQLSDSDIKIKSVEIQML
jgi:hypothetical protein